MTNTVVSVALYIIGYGIQTMYLHTNIQKNAINELTKLSTVWNVE